MKVLQINCVYPSGSTGKLVHELHQGLMNHNHESVVFYGRGDKYIDNNVIKTCSEFEAKVSHLFSMFSGLMYGGCAFSTHRLIRLIVREKPDVVHLHCINGYFVNIYRLVNWLKKHQIKTVVTNHAEFYYTANCSHAFECEKWKSGCGHCPYLKKATKSLFLDRTALSYKKMRIAFDGFGLKLTVVSASEWGAQRSKESLILKGFDHRTIMNGVDTSVFTFHRNDDLKKEYGIEHEKVILHVSAHFTDVKDHPKGGWAVIQLAKMLENEPIKILVASARTEFNGSCPSNVVFLGSIQSQHQLAQLYSMADLSLIASRRETFSMPCAESLCCGTPVVGFKAGAPEMISLPDFSGFAEYGDVDGLKQLVLSMLSTSFNKEEISTVSKETYSKEKMIQSYLTIYEE